MCEYLEEHGIMQYEISNFAVPGFESRHNLKYWHDEEYLGIGASAHSFLGGKRTYYPRDIEYFISGNERLTEGDGGDEEEFCMLALRLREGLTQERFYARFHHEIPQKMLESAKQYEKYGLCSCESGGIFSDAARIFTLQLRNIRNYLIDINISGLVICFTSPFFVLFGRL